MRKAYPVSVSITPDIAQMLDELQGLYIKLGKNKSRSSIIVSLIKMAYPTLKRRLIDELMKEGIKYDEPFNRLMKAILFDWREEV